LLQLRTLPCNVPTASGFALAQRGAAGGFLVLKPAGVCYTEGMKTPARSSLFGLVGLTLLAVLLAVGCDGSAPDREEVKAKEKAKEPEKPAEAKKVLLAKNIFLEVRGQERRVLISAEVCLREGQLELLMCRKPSKEHEAILTADVDARKIHAALNAAGAIEGSPVRFQPKYRPASGTKIKVSVQYKDKGKLVTVPARSWVKNMKTGKELETDWVFAGSREVVNPLDPDGKKYYLANDGDLICVSNFEGALLDLPIKSSKEAADLIFTAFTERIPPLETKVVVILEPVPEPKKDKREK
jgi:hypothetical protein